MTAIIVSIIQSKFINNTVMGSRVAFYGGFISNSLVYLEAISKIVRLSQFVNNRLSFAVVNIAYKTDHPENLIGNVLADNSNIYLLP